MWKLAATKVHQKGMKQKDCYLIGTGTYGVTNGPDKWCGIAVVNDAGEPDTAINARLLVSAPHLADALREIAALPSERQDECVVIARRALDEIWS